MSSAPAGGRPRPGPVLSLIVLACFVLLLGLGVWQVQRLKWKTDLLRRIAALQAAPAEPIGPVLRRATEGVDVGFVRVQTDCPGLEQGPTLRLYGLLDGQVGYRLIAACPLRDEPFATLLVDRGFVPMNLIAAAGAPGRPLAQPVVGVLRTPDHRTLVTPPNQPASNLWYWRDLPAMAAALHATSPAPATLMLERPAPLAPWPRPAPLPVNIPNNHLGYAITWFGLAAALAGVYLAMLLRRRP